MKMGIAVVLLAAMYGTTALADVICQIKSRNHGDTMHAPVLATFGTADASVPGKIAASNVTVPYDGSPVVPYTADLWSKGDIISYSLDPDGVTLTISIEYTANTAFSADKQPLHQATGIKKLELLDEFYLVDCAVR